MRRLLDSDSSSTHVLNADAKLPIPLKALYLLANWINNTWWPQSDGGIVQRRHFDSSLTEADLATVLHRYSPGRALSDLFLTKINWGYCRDLLGDIRIFDTGCGTGEYALKLHKAAQGHLQAYFGVDIRERAEWPELMKANPWMTLRKLGSSDVGPAIPEDTTVFFTISAIEHFEQDLRYFARLNDFVSTAKRPVLQIHIFPAGATLKTYLLHGVRQYTPRTVAKLVQRFPHDTTQNLLYSLGGPKCNRLHFSLITVPVHTGRPLRKGISLEEYAKLRNSAILEDAKSNGQQPSVYALLMLSRGEKGALDRIIIR